MPLVRKKLDGGERIKKVNRPIGLGKEDFVREKCPKINFCFRIFQKRMNYVDK